jgi:hypothetical protein
MRPMAAAAILVVLAIAPLHPGLLNHDSVAASSGTVSRLAGGDRYATAVAVSRADYPSGAATVYVASGGVFPDALSGGPAAARAGGPVLLVARTAIPEVTAAELRRLKPQRIVVLGGTAVVSDGVAKALSSYTSGSGGVGGIWISQAELMALKRPGFGGDSIDWRKMESCQTTEVHTRPSVAIRPRCVSAPSGWWLRPSPSRVNVTAR